MTALNDSKARTIENRSTIKRSDIQGLNQNSSMETAMVGGLQSRRQSGKPHNDLNNDDMLDLNLFDKKDKA